jgi:Cdc6-like AAA superfamily ATPase
VLFRSDPNFFNHDAQAGGFFPLTHINPGFDIDSFIRGSGKNILVEGIRGTGKTHILKMIASKCIDTYPEEKICQYTFLYRRFLNGKVAISDFFVFNYMPIL